MKTKLNFYCFSAVALLATQAQSTKVLVFGGSCGDIDCYSTNTSDIYDSKSKQWTSGPELITAQLSQEEQ